MVGNGNRGRVLIFWQTRRHAPVGRLLGESVTDGYPNPITVMSPDQATAASAESASPVPSGVGVENWVR